MSEFELLSDIEREQVIQDALKAANDKKKMELDVIAKEERRKEYEKYFLDSWDARKYFDYIKLRSNNILKKELILDKFNTKIIKLLCTYFANDKFFEEQGYSLKKGLYIYGPVGTGKTFIMKLFSKNQKRTYQIFSSRHICDLYQEIGSSCLHEYSNPVYWVANQIDTFNQKEFGRCFDDMGAESLNRSHWGNRIIPMREIICYIYEKQSSFFYFHITSNLPPESISQIYGERTYSRMKEMFNFIKLDGIDKRK